MSRILAAAPSGTNADSIAVATIFWILAVISVGAALGHDPGPRGRCTARSCSPW